LIQLNEGIALISGAMFNYGDPASSQVTIEDIAFALGNVCRFSGHIPFYSVAQHCVNVSHLVPERHAFTALMHDTAEAFTNDIPTPLKVAVPAFKDLEGRIEQAMAYRFGFQYPFPPEVTYADLQMLRAEKQQLKGDFSHWQILDGIEMPPAHLINMDRMQPEEAAEAYLNRFYALGGRA
jgi:hypothetical protein